MKRSLVILGAILAALVLFPTPAPAGVTSQYMHAKSPLRYQVQRYTFSTTSDITAAVVGVVPPGGGTLKAVVLTQTTAGEGGTSWVAVPKIGTDELTTTDGGFTIGAGACTTTNLTNPMGALATVAGCTRPTITAANATQSGGQVVTVTITLTGTYTSAVAGVVELYWEPRF